MLKPSLCDYSDAYPLIQSTLSVPNTGAAAVPDNRNKKIILRNCARITDYISKVINIQIYNAKDID